MRTHVRIDRQRNNRREPLVSEFAFLLKRAGVAQSVDADSLDLSGQPPTGSLVGSNPIARIPILEV